jgi:hypothetical protein
MKQYIIHVGLVIDTHNTTEKKVDFTNAVTIL